MNEKELYLKAIRNEAYEEWLFSFDEINITLPKGFRKMIGFSASKDGFMGSKNQWSRIHKWNKVKRVKSSYKKYDDEALILEDLYADPCVEEIYPGTFIRVV